MTIIKFAVLALVLGFAHASNPDEVTSLPGVNFKIPFKHYSGYLEALDGNFLHYWFFESQNNTQSDPVVLWLNGGPGCSSLLGALTEQGPLKVVTNQSLALNPYAWNVRNSIIFLESPAGVGFSYNANGNYTTGDDETAANNFAALQSFFKKYPHLANNDFYITGESYGGIYVPTLSVIALDKKFPKNFKGFAIGNGYLDTTLLGNSVLHFAHYHGLFDDVLWNNLVTKCCHNVTNTRNCDFVHNQNSECQKVHHEAEQKISHLHLNHYNIYDECQQSKHNTQDLEQRQLMIKALLRGDVGAYYLNQVGNTPPCLNQDVPAEYLNQEDVRKALHIDSKANKWTPCSNVLHYHSKYHSTMEQVRHMLKSGLKGLIYNGDVDTVCNFLGDMWFSEELGFKTIKEYSPWMYENQVGGFVKIFENFAYTTIRGSGHMVPTDRPGPAQHMFYKFLES